MSGSKRRRILASADLGKLANLKAGDFVQCDSEGILYPAKILEIRESKNNKKTYAIHYQNWNKVYDETIPEDEAAERFELFDQVPDKSEIRRLSSIGIPRVSFGDAVPIDDEEPADDQEPISDQESADEQEPADDQQLSDEQESSDEQEPANDQELSDEQESSDKEDWADEQDSVDDDMSPDVKSASKSSRKKSSSSNKTASKALNEPIKVVSVAAKESSKIEPKTSRFPEALNEPIKAAPKPLKKSNKPASKPLKKSNKPASKPLNEPTKTASKPLMKRRQAASQVFKEIVKKVVPKDSSELGKPTSKALDESSKSVPTSPREPVDEQALFSQPNLPITDDGQSHASTQSLDDVSTTEDRELLDLPQGLCEVLVTDMNNFAQGKTLKPPQCTIEEIIEKYTERLDDDSEPNDNHYFCADNIASTFNYGVRLMLLYGPEWAGYDEMFEDAEGEESPHQYYGFVHLVRLFAQLSEVLNVLEADRVNSLKLLNNVTHFINFVENNCDDWFDGINDYHW